MNTKTGKIDSAIDQKLIDAHKQNLKRLSDIEHRLEYVDMFDGIEYVNDAKASDINSSWYSIDCMEKPVVWIVSSCNYEEDYSLFYEIEASKVKALVVLGPNQGAVEEVFKGRVKTIAHAEHLENALKLARSFSVEGDIVLYSPAFSDFDQFSHYKERGQQFRKAVRELHLK